MNGYFNRFDILEAYYLWLFHNHPGQWSLEYLRLCGIQRYFTPAQTLSYLSLTDNGKAIYNNLDSKRIEKQVRV
jgi:hypothetical protein